MASTDSARGGFTDVATAGLSRALTSTPFLGIVVGALTWPIYSIVPATGPDPSWVAGLYMAHGEGLQFGTQLVFTYGPLGFLQEPVLYDETMWMVAFLYRGFIHFALATSLIWVARRALPLALALVLAYVLLVLGYPENEVVLLAFIWCFAALGRCPPPFAAPLIAIGGGAIAAIELLGKLNFGIGVLALCSIALLGMPGRRRNVPTFVGVTLTSLVALWLLAGQGLGNVPEFLSNAIEIVSGYSRSMSADISEVGWELPLAVVATVLLLAAAALASWRDPWPRRLASLALVAVFSYLTFKQGFVRQGLGGTPAFFALTLGAGMAISARLPARPPRLPASVLAAVLVIPLVVLTAAASPRPSLWEALKPDDHAVFLRQHLEALLDPGERERLVARGRSSMRDTYGLDRDTLRAIRGRPVHVDPWEIGVAWAYGLSWHPLPVIQGYSAYTPALDRLNADALAGPDAPALVLRQRTEAFTAAMSGSIDDRYAGWDPPAAMVSMLCHYRTLRVTRRWQLLEHVGERCGPARPIGVVRSRTGRQVPVPRPPSSDDIVLARIEGVGVEGWESIRTLLYRARQRFITIDGRSSWRLVPETAADGLIMRASRTADFAAPFRLAPDAKRVAVRIEGAAPRDIRVRFFAQRVGSIDSRPKPIRPS